MTPTDPTTDEPLGLLLVDDHPVVRAGLKALLEADGTLVVRAEAGDGAEALAALDAQPVDVVIMDLQMPTMDGPTAIRRLRHHGGPPVLVLTTYETQADIVSALEAGATGYLLKDSPADQLREAVRQTAQGRSVLAPSVTQQLVDDAERTFAQRREERAHLQQKLEWDARGETPPPPPAAPPVAGSTTLEDDLRALRMSTGQGAPAPPAPPGWPGPPPPFSQAHGRELGSAPPPPQRPPRPY